MNRVFKAFHSLDVEAQSVSFQELPDSFDPMFLEFPEEKLKIYTLKEGSNLVADCIRNMIQEQDGSYRQEMTKVIAKHLLECEVLAQGKIYPMDAHVKKGSLLQMLVQKAEDEYQYILAKVEHSAWCDGSSLAMNYGFSLEKKSIWKYACFNAYTINDHVFFEDVHVLNDNKSKYWTVSFLDVEPKRDDASNTMDAFRAMDNELKSALKESAPRDYVVLSNEIMNTMNTPQTFEYSSYVETLMDHYEPVNEDVDTEVIKDCLMALPNRKKFDTSFKVVPESIENKRTKKYGIAQGVELVIKSNANDFSKRITSTVKNGKRVLEIICDDLDTYDAFIEENDE